MGPVLDLRNAAFEARVCKDGNETGSEVSDIAFINLGRMLWIESAEAERTLSFQLDADSWLKLRFAEASVFARADADCTALVTGKGA